MAWDGPVWRDGDFVYDDVAHEYRLKDVVIPGVSTILTPCVEFGDAPRHVIENAAIRGKAVHRACELWDEGDLDEELLDARLVPYLNGWKKFRRDWDIEFTASEIPDYHRTMHYGGTPDRKGIWKQKKIGLDLKATYKLNDSVELQLAGYDLLEEEPADELWSVRVTKTGGYERHVHKPCHDLFIALWKIYQWRASKGLQYKRW